MGADYTQPGSNINVFVLQHEALKRLTSTSHLKAFKRHISPLHPVSFRPKAQMFITVRNWEKQGPTKRHERNAAISSNSHFKAPLSLKSA
jgi:hypothetical protein